MVAAVSVQRYVLLVLASGTPAWTSTVRRRRHPAGLRSRGLWPAPGCRAGRRPGGGRGL